MLKTTYIADLTKRLEKVSSISAAISLNKYRIVNVERKISLIIENKTNGITHKSTLYQLGPGNTADGDVMFTALKSREKTLWIATKTFPLTKQELEYFETVGNIGSKPKYVSWRELYASICVSMIARRQKFPNVVICMGYTMLADLSPEVINNDIIRQHMQISGAFRVLDTSLRDVDRLYRTEGSRREQKNNEYIKQKIIQVEKAFEKRFSYRQYTNQGLMIFYELAEENLHDFINANKARLRGADMISIIGQAIMSILFLYNKCDLIHMDSHIKNFLVSTFESASNVPRYWLYKVDDDKFYIPNRGFRVFICDFSRSLSVKADNPKVVSRKLKSYKKFIFEKRVKNTDALITDVYRFLSIVEEYNILPELDKYVEKLGTQGSSAYPPSVPEILYKIGIPAVQPEGQIDDVFEF